MKLTLLLSLLTISQLAFSGYEVKTKTHGKQDFLEQIQNSDSKKLPQRQEAPKKMNRK